MTNGTAAVQALDSSADITAAFPGAIPHFEGCILGEQIGKPDSIEPVSEVRVVGHQINTVSINFACMADRDKAYAEYKK